MTQMQFNVPRRLSSDAWATMEIYGKETPTDVKSYGSIIL